MSPSVHWFRALIGILAWMACSVAIADNNTAKVDFNRDIRTILSNKCFKCHGPDENERQASLRLDTQAGAWSQAESDAIPVVPGKPEASELIRRIISADGDEKMPPEDSGKTLTAKQIQLLTEWVRQGGEYARHWSYQKPRRADLPKVTAKDWPRNAIDYFILARLERDGISHSVAADRFAIIRRVSLDLTGLPPTLEEVDRFVNDSDSAAYDDMIDRLLAKNTFGEHWARKWLDLARYADSAGYADDPARVIWGYRDWVIQAINRNLRFDQFTIEQIAGDLFENPTDDQLIATAFHRNTLTNNEGGTSDEEYRNVAVIDRVNTTMAVWMGTTIACAQCHSHKYDPITQEDYFRMFAIFNNTEDADRKDESPLVQKLTEAQIQQQTKLKTEIENLEKQIANKIPKTMPKLTIPVEKGPLKTQYIRIELPGNAKYLSLAEVQVFTENNNVATAGKATQISTGYEGPAKLAIDGNTNGDYNAAKSTTHTTVGNDPWWEVDLGKQVAVGRIEIWNRTDSNVEYRLTGYRVILMNSKREPLWVSVKAALPKPSAKLAPPQTAEQLNKPQRDAVLAYMKGAKKTDPQKAELQALKKKLAGIKGITIPIMRELAVGKRRKTHIQHRGNFLDLGKEVTEGLPEAIYSVSEEKLNRLTLAKWMVDEDNPLTARVIANRYWEAIFGIGLVRSSEEFGTQGELPTHPELLDYLATELIRLNWDTKAFLKLLVTSAAYRQSSRVTPQLLELDPDNRLLARGPRFRISAEMIRDQALMVSGLLSDKMYGPPVKPPQPQFGVKAAFGGGIDWNTSEGEDRYRRGIYTTWRRSNPYPSMAVFDAPNREVCTVRRDRTNTPLQALVTLNDPVYIEAAQALGRRMAAAGDTTETKVRYGFRLCLTRHPSDSELQHLVKLFDVARQRFSKTPELAKSIATVPIGTAPKDTKIVDLAAWTIVSNLLLNLDEMFLKR